MCHPFVLKIVRINQYCSYNIGLLCNWDITSKWWKKSTFTCTSYVMITGAHTTCFVLRALQSRSEQKWSKLPFPHIHDEYLTKYLIYHHLFLKFHLNLNQYRSCNVRLLCYWSIQMKFCDIYTVDFCAPSSGTRHELNYPSTTEILLNRLSSNFH